MNAPTMPTMMLPISPKPMPRTIWPASQPATAPTIRTMTIASSPMVVLPARRAPTAFADATKEAIMPPRSRLSAFAGLRLSTIRTRSDMMRFSSKSFGV